VKEIVIQAPAKLNLTLDVLGKRPDGYHEMRMVMQSVDLADQLTLALGPGEGIEVTTDVRFLPTDRRNLAVKAAGALAAATGERLEGLRIHIRKQVPVCAGMAGGSADAAAVLLGLNELWGTALPVEELARIGEGVGSDVPYCVRKGTALAEGRGERLTALPAMPSCWAAIVKPSFSVSTPELFRELDGKRVRCHPDTEGMLSALDRGDLPGICRRLYNVFEEVLPLQRRRTVEEIKQVLLREGALGASMTGTGPTVFGLFDRREAAEQALAALETGYEKAAVARTM